MNDKKVLLASNNKGKINEIKEIFKDATVFSISEIEKIIGKKIIVTEDYDTYEENALSKVKDLYNYVGEDYILIGDDSGLSIDALDGFPGVHTARWIDEDDHTKNVLLLDKLKNEENRTCHYTTVISLKYKNLEKVFSATIDGNISTNFRGDNGFGFDEIFELDNGKTLAEIDILEKLKISPRTKALEKLKDYIESNNI